MDVNRAFLELRELKNIKKSSITLGKTRSTYSRIEDGKIAVSFLDFVNFADTLNLTLNETITYMSQDIDYAPFKEVINICVNNPKDLEGKKKLLKFYNKNLDLVNSSKKELFYYVSIKANFHGEWEEVSDIQDSYVNKILNQLLCEYFYTEYDYLIAVHLCRYLSTSELELLIKRMFPLSELHKRNEQTIKSANLLVTNAISIYIYTLEYELAYELINLAEKETSFLNNYYIKIEVLFMKNIVLNFLKHDTKYIEQARHVINLVRELGDTSLANAFETELNNLTSNPSYYKDKIAVELVTARS